MGDISRRIRRGGKGHHRVALICTQDMQFVARGGKYALTVDEAARKVFGMMLIHKAYSKLLDGACRDWIGLMHMSLASDLLRTLGDWIARISYLPHSVGQSGLGCQAYGAGN